MATIKTKTGKNILVSKIIRFGEDLGYRIEFVSFYIILGDQMQREEEQEKFIGSNGLGLKVYLKPPSSSQNSYELVLDQQYLLIKSQLQQIKLGLRDIIGVKTIHIVDNTYKIEINSFPLTRRFLRKSQRAVVSTQIWTQTTKEKIQRCQVQILRRITNRQISNKDELKFIVYFNPVAGSNSKSHVHRLRQFASHTNFQLEVIETEGKNYCKEHIKTIDLSKYKAVLIVSGDGLMHEFVNSSACGKIPVTHIPAGSGNAFAKTQSAEAGQECSTEVAMYLAIKGRTKAFNLFEVQLQNRAESIYSFLSIEWAFMADIDINSQFLRFCGGLRFEIYSAWRLLALKRYPGKITYSFQNKKLPDINTPIVDPSFHVAEGQFLSVLFTFIPFISDKYEFSPLLQIEDKAIDMQFLCSHHGRWNLLKYLLNSQTGAHFDRQKKELKEGAVLGWSQIKCFRLQPEGVGELKGIYAIDGEQYEAQKVQVSLSNRQLISFV